MSLYSVLVIKGNTGIISTEQRRNGRQRKAMTAIESNEKAGRADGQHHSPVTLRAVLLGLFGAGQAAFVQMWTKVHPSLFVPPWIEGPYLSWYAVMPGAIFWIFLLAIINGFLKRFAPRHALRPAEFALIFGISTVGAAVAGQDEAMPLLPIYLYPWREAQADALGPFRQFIPLWMVPHDPKVVEPYYLGNTTFWTIERITAWALPLLTWTTYLGVLGATMWSWNIILRRRWIDADRLTFPNMQVPLTICREAGFGGLVAGRIFWGGFIAATLFDSMQPIQQLYPPFPAFPNSVDLTGILQTFPSPWSALAPMQVMWPTVYLGICFLIPLDILFSAGAFFALRKLMEVFGRAMGWRELGWDVGGFPYSRSQASGAWIALFFLLVWAERHHLMRVLDSAFSTRPGPYDEQEAQEFGSYRFAGRMLVAGTLFLIAFSVAGGMSPLVAVIFYAYYWMMQVTMTRVYCQVGPPTFEPYFLNPQTALTTIFGSVGIAPATAVHLNLMNFLTNNPCAHPMAHQMSALHIGRQTNADSRPFGRWILVAMAFGGLALLLSYLHFAYRVGEDLFRFTGWKNVGAAGAFEKASQLIHSPKGPQGAEIVAVFVGGGITLALAKAGATLLGFPLHPVGFALAMCYGVEYSWPAFLFMALFKFLTLRYGGRALYETFVPFFLGLTLGGILTPVLWGWAAWAFNWFP